MKHITTPTTDQHKISIEKAKKNIEQVRGEMLQLKQLLKHFTQILYEEQEMLKIAEKRGIKKYSYMDLIGAVPKRNIEEMLEDENSSKKE